MTEEVEKKQIKIYRYHANQEVRREGKKSRCRDSNPDEAGVALLVVCSTCKFIISSAYVCYLDVCGGDRTYVAQGLAD